MIVGRETHQFEDPWSNQVERVVQAGGKDSGRGALVSVREVVMGCVGLDTLEDQTANDLGRRQEPMIELMDVMDDSGNDQSDGECQRLSSLEKSHSSRRMHYRNSNQP